MIVRVCHFYGYDKRGSGSKQKMTKCDIEGGGQKYGFWK